MINSKTYDDSSPISIELYASQLKGKTFKSLLPNGVDSYKGKGGLGQVVEKYYFNYDLNSNKNADFEKAGIELKVSPYKINKNKSLSAKERLVLTIINYMEVVNETFYDSSLIKKNNALLLLYYLYEKDVDKLDYKINYVHLFSFPEEDLKIIKDDWEKIVSKIKSGKAHELSESDTFYLSACTKGANKSSVRNQPFSDIPAKQRAFSLKNKYMTYILNEYIVKNKRTYQHSFEDFKAVSESIEEYKVKSPTYYESIIKNIDDLKGINFESYVTNIINENIGKSAESLAKQYKLKNHTSKSFTSQIALKMLGVNSKNANEFEKANVKVKCIRIGKNDKIKEHMSFPAFKFNDIVKEDWETSTLRTLLSETKFLFIIFKFDSEGVLRLHNSMFWNMPIVDLDTHVKSVWDKTVNIIKQGVQTQQRGKRVFNNFPSASDNKVSHIRPHALNKNDTYPLPDGREFTKQSFWLNNSYILKQIEEE